MPFFVSVDYVSTRVKVALHVALDIINESTPIT